MSDDELIPMRCPECSAELLAAPEAAEAYNECPQCGELVLLAPVPSEDGQAPSPRGRIELSDRPDRFSRCRRCGMLVDRSAGACPGCGKPPAPSKKRAPRQEPSGRSRSASRRRRRRR